MDWTTAANLVRAVADHNGVIVLLTPPTSIIAARLRARDEPRDPALIRRLTRAYRHIFPKSRCLP